jgi:hypothetical protein
MGGASQRPPPSCREAIGWNFLARVTKGLGQWWYLLFVIQFVAVLCRRAITLASSLAAAPLLNSIDSRAQGSGLCDL